MTDETLPIEFACVFDGNGGARQLAADGFASWRPADGVLWVDMLLTRKESREWLAGDGGIDDTSRPNSTPPHVRFLNESRLLALLYNTPALDDAHPDHLPLHLISTPTQCRDQPDRDRLLLAPSINDEPEIRHPE
jgi:hypothetical protein